MTRSLGMETRRRLTPERLATITAFDRLPPTLLASAARLG